MTAQHWQSMLLLVAFGTTLGCSHPSAAPETILPENPPKKVEGVAPARKPSIRLGSSRFRHQLDGQALAFSPDSKTLFSGGSDGKVIAWNVETGDAQQTIAAHTG